MHVYRDHVSIMEYATHYQSIFIHVAVLMDILVLLNKSIPKYQYNIVIIFKIRNQM